MPIKLLIGISVFSVWMTAHNVRGYVENLAPCENPSGAGGAPEGMFNITRIWRSQKNNGNSDQNNLAILVTVTDNVFTVTVTEIEREFT